MDFLVDDLGDAHDAFDWVRRSRLLPTSGDAEENGG
jgi:hypothetical protein